MISAAQVLGALEKHTNVLLYGPPGTGKSHLMKEVEILFKKKFGSGVGPRFAINTEAERSAITEIATSAAHSRWVTFHQGYSYEDFIIGLRPKTAPAKDGSLLALEARAGALVELAASARNGYGLMLIDEINRGNASRIFGEFITLMETDKRLGEDGKESETTVTVTLPYIAKEEKIEVEAGVEVEREFRMPRRIYTLASMNSVDKSVAPIDSAIRRRFYVFHLTPTQAALTHSAGAVGSKNSVAKLAVQLMQRLNRGIGIHLGPDYMLGQYYLPINPKIGEMTEEEAKKKLVDSWRHRILPQLVELFQARPAVCKSLLRLDELDHSGLEVVQPSDKETDEGASIYIATAEATESDDEILEYLKKFTATDEAPNSP